MTKEVNAEGHPPSPPFKGGKSAVKEDVELTADCRKSPERAC